MPTPEGIWEEGMRRNAKIHSTLSSIRLVTTILLSLISSAVLQKIWLISLLQIQTNVLAQVIALFALFFGHLVILTVLLEQLIDPSFWILSFLVRIEAWKSYTKKDLKLYHDREKRFKQGGLDAWM